MNEHAIVADGLTRRYGDELAIDELSLSIPSGSVYGFLGPNGVVELATVVAGGIVASGLGTLFPRASSIDVTADRSASVPSKTAFGIFTSRWSPRQASRTR